MQLSHKVSLNFDAINGLDLSHLAHFMSWNPTYQAFFSEQAGKEPYKLLAYLAKEIQGEICDLGTLFGSSALALSYNESNTVLTLDTCKRIPEMQGNITVLNRPNIKFLVASAQAILPHIAKSNLVYMDFDSQNIEELQKVVSELEYYNCKGLLLINDIHLNDQMKGFWENIPKHLKKVDVTRLGHFTGTGIVVFDPEHLDIDIN